MRTHFNIVKDTYNLTNLFFVYTFFLFDIWKSFQTFNVGNRMKFGIQVKNFEEYLWKLKCQYDLGFFYGKMVSYIVVVFVRLTHTIALVQCNQTSVGYLCTEVCMCLFIRLTTVCTPVEVEYSVVLPFSMIQCVFYMVCEARFSQKC